jgi:hypothetical protein
MRTVKALVQQTGFEGLLVPEDLWRLRDGIIVAPATGDFADLVGEQIGTGRVRRQVVRIEGATAARRLCPTTSDLDLLGDLNSIVDLDAKISNRALNLRVAQQQLHRTQIASSPVDQSRLGSAPRVCAELERVEADTSTTGRRDGRIDVSSAYDRCRRDR